MSLRAPLGCCTLVMLLVVAAPAHAAPVSGQLNMAGGVVLEGGITWSEGAHLVEVEADDGIPPFALDVRASHATVWVERQSSQGLTGFLMGDSFRRAQTTPETLSQVRLQDLRLHDDAHITAALAEATETVRTERAVLDAAHQVYASVDPHDQTRYTEPGFAYSIAGQDWIVARAEGIATEGSGTFTLAFWDTEMTLESAEGAREYRAGSWTEASGSAAPLHENVFQVVWIEFRDATFRFDWGGDALVAGPAPRIDVVGSATMSATRGSLLVDALGVSPAVQTVTIVGDYSLGPSVDRSAEARSAPPRDPVALYDRFDSGVRGHAERVEVSGLAVHTADDGAGQIVAAGAAGMGLVALLAAAYRWGPLALAALYSRLEEGELLDNPTRAHIFEIIKQNPGISARHVHRLSSASWGTVVHHLGKLASGGYVATRTHGRSKCYYENHGKWDDHQEQLAVLTGDKTAAVADAILAVPGRDQSQIMTRTGYSQSTVSYHLIKLEKVGLISKERSGNALAYFPTVALRDLRTRLGPDTITAGTPVGGAA